MKFFQQSSPTKIKPITEKLDSDKLIKKYKISSESKLANNIKLACQATNKVRSMLRSSHTHPSFSEYSHQQVAAANVNVLLVRSLSKYIAYGISILPGLNDISSNFNSTVKYMSALTHYGNCSEYSLLAKEAVKKLDENINVEIYYILFGDHVFVVIDREQNSNISDYKTWGDNAVVCDAWGGKVFPAHLIPKELLDHIPELDPPGRLGHFDPSTQRLLLHEQEPDLIAQNKQGINSIRMAIILMGVMSYLVYQIHTMLSISDMDSSGNHMHSYN